MTRRVVIGALSGESGIKVSKPGFDALVATGDALLLSMTSRTEQIILSGVASPLPQTIITGLLQRPYVFLRSSGVVPVDIGGSQQTQTGLTRPWPPAGSSTSINCQADVSAGSIVISGGSASCHYIVVRRASP